MHTCNHCGREYRQGARFCQGCGNPLAPPAAGPVQAAPMSQPRRGNPATAWLIVNIVATLCCGGWLNIVGIIFAALGVSSYNQGKDAQGEEQTRAAKIIFWIGLGLGLVTIIVALFTIILPIVLTGGVLGLELLDQLQYNTFY